MRLVPRMPRILTPTHHADDPLPQLKAAPRPAYPLAGIGLALLIGIAACGLQARATSGDSSTPIAISPSATPEVYPTYPNDSLTIANVPQAVVDRIPADLTEQPTSDAAVPEATAAATADPNNAPDSTLPTSVQLEGYVLATANPPSASDGPLVWIFVYYSPTELQFGCVSSSNCGGHYYFASVNATTGQEVPYLTGLEPGS